MKIPREAPPCLTLWAALLLAAPGLTARAEGPEGERVRLGAVSYRIHCQNCHGGGGTGDGPMAELLKISPTDLTRLAEKNGGELPRERIYRAIDGRDEIASHGSRQMPVWGIGFQDPGRATDQEGPVRAKILDLVAYLETLQAGGRKPANRPGG